MLSKFALSIVALTLLASCSGPPAAVPTVPPLPSPLPASATPNPTATITPVPGTSTPGTLQLSIRAMAYNIELGAGVDPSAGRPSKFNDLIKLVQQANPDLLGIEEANGWDAGHPSAADRFAEALGMTYYLAPARSGPPNVLFSKFPILETENLSESIGDHGALRAVVQLPGGQKLDVVVVHLFSGDNMTVVQPCQYYKLRRIMETHPGGLSILMGDVNSHANDPETTYLTTAGWELAWYDGVDNMYVRSVQQWKRDAICFARSPSNPYCIYDKGISDHLPVAAVLSFYSSPNPLTGAATALPPTPEACS